MAKNSQKIKGISVFCSLLFLSWYLLYFSSDESSDQLRYLKVNRSVQSGRSLQFSEISFSRKKPIEKIDSVLTDQDIDKIQRSVLKVSLEQGDWIRWEHLLEVSKQKSSDVKIPKGMRAHLIQVDSISHLRAHDWVDVILSNSSQDNIPITLIERIQVLYVGFRGQNKQVLVAVYPTELELLEKAQLRGKLRLALRNPDEPEAKMRRRVQLKRNKTSKIEIWSEEE